MDPSIQKHKDFLLQFSHECLVNAQEAVKGYSETKNIHATIQLMNQAFQCAKMAQCFYMQTFERREIELFEDFFHQFTLLNWEFLKALRDNQSLQWSLIELEKLEKIYNELKLYLS